MLSDKIIREFNTYKPSCPDLDENKKKEILLSYNDKDLQDKEEKEFFEKYKGKYHARMDFDLSFFHRDYEDSLRARLYDKLYVGKKDLQDSNGKYLIVDWRRPVGEFFNEDEKRSLSIREGNYCSDYDLMLKRQFLNADSFEYRDLFVFGNELYDSGDIDSFLIKVLEKLREERREDAVDIIETLQFDQSKIIHQPVGKNFFVQGCAGSGKTMVMLHRLSWILFNNRGIDVKKIKIITPNNNIIEQIKELSEQLEIGSIQKITTEEYFLYLIEKYSHKVYKGLTKDRVFKNESALDCKFLDYIYSDDFKHKIDKAYNEFFENLFVVSETKVEGEYSSKNFEENLKKAVDSYREFCKQRTQEDEEKQLDAIVERIKNSAGIKSKADSKKKNDVDERFKVLLKCVDIEESEYVAKDNLRERIIMQIFKNSITECYVNSGITAKGILYKHHAYIMLYILQKFFGAKNLDLFLNIDEAQDITPNEYKVIMCANTNATFNLYGDTQQLLYKNRGISDWRYLPMDLERFDLKVNYRNSKDITEYCNEKISLCDMSSVGVDDGAVYHIGKEGFTKQIEVGDVVIVKNESEIYELFAQPEIFNFIKDKDDKISKFRPNVFTVETVKGAEFSGDVYVVDKNMTENEKYVAYTRALKSLILVK